MGKPDHFDLSFQNESKFFNIVEKLLHKQDVGLSLPKNPLMYELSFNNNLTYFG